MTSESEREEQEQDKISRVFCEYLGTWNVCDNAACRRAHKCRGNVDVCIKRNCPRLPNGVREWFTGLLNGHDEGMSFDEARERMAKTPSAEAFAAWRASLPG